MAASQTGADRAQPDPTENARRAARFKFAEDRIRRIVDGAPALTAAQREHLALLLHPGTGSSDAA